MKWWNILPLVCQMLSTALYIVWYVFGILCKKNGEIKSVRGRSVLILNYDHFDFERWEFDKLDKWESSSIIYVIFCKTIFVQKKKEKKNLRFLNLRKCGFHNPDVMYSDLPTQLSQRLQWEARGGRNILHVKQYFNLTTCPLMTTSLVLGGGR